MEFFDDWVITIKGETHNHPSAIAPFAGIATKHGGVIRDTIGFGKGAYPIGGSTIMGTMDPRMPKEDVPAGALHPAYIVRESIRATAFYCNSMGIPMMYPVYKAHPNYPKCLALGHSIGLVPRQYALKDTPQCGDTVLLFGGRTGRDGLHGATSSSAETTGGVIAKKESAAVPTGDPLTERKFMDAVPVLRDRGCIRSITDLGAGGISSAAGEMGSQTGVSLNLDLVPLKDPSLTAWEIILSESQERMLAAIPPEKLEEAEEILDRYGVESVALGEFTDTGRFTAYWRREKVVDISMEFLWGTCPIDPIPIEEKPLDTDAADVGCPSSLDDLAELAKDVLSHYNCCDQSPAGFQFDSTVQGRTVIGPFSGITGKMPTDVFVSAPLRGKKYGVISTIGYNPFYGDISPEELVRLTMIEAVSRAVAVGADPDAIALCDNFYTPRSTPEVAWHLTKMVEAAARLSIRLGMPFISGKDSSSGTFVSKDGENINVPYTFAVSTLCRVPDVSRLVTKPFKVAGNKIVLVGDIDPEALGGSIYYDLFDKRGDVLPDSSDDMVSSLISFWSELYQIYSSEDNPIKAASAIGEGGTFVRLFEMCYGSGLGANIDIPKIHPGRFDGAMFGEGIGCMLFEMDSDVDPDQVFAGYKWRVIGEVMKDPVIRLTAGSAESIELSIDELTRVWEAPFKEVL
jgi:phosphoribosylformylglycinamidine synthase II